jgi:glycosyltransferase involved in cell wall biosynthesis
LNLHERFRPGQVPVVGQRRERVGDRSLRILHVFRAPVGGLFRHVLDVTRGQVERGHQVGLLCDSSSGGERAEEILEALRPKLALGVTRVAMRRDLHPQDLMALAALGRAYRSLTPDVLHGHGSKGGAYVRLVSSRALDSRTIRIYTPHGGSFHYPPGTLRHAVYMAAEKFLARRTDAFIFESEYIAGRFRAFVGDTNRLVRVVYNGLASAEFAPVPARADPFDLMCIGELRPGKGVETLIDAVALLRRERQLHLTLLLVGSGASRDALQEQAKKAGIADATTFLPPQPIREALGRARVMVMPSHAESLPYVILEAAAAGQPLVATRVGGIPEIFGPCSDELVPANDVPALAEAIQAKLGEPEATRQAKTHRLRQVVNGRFTIEHMVDGVLGVYGEALKAKEISPVDRPTADLH